MDDYIATNSRVQGPPDSPSIWAKGGPTAEKWGGGNIANDNVRPVDDYSRRLAERQSVELADLDSVLDGNGRRGSFLQTFSGRQFWPMDPLPEEVCIEDIAHSLAMQTRYAGHVLQFYSVAEHSVHIADWLLEHHGPGLALAGLLHDASEAYLCDVPRPVKPYLAGYKDAEARVQRAVHEAFGLPADIPALVHEADNRILIDERNQNMAPANYEGGWPDGEPLGVKLEFWSPAFAKAVFLMRFSALTVGASEERRAA